MLRSSRWAAVGLGLAAGCLCRGRVLRVEVASSAPVLDGKPSGAAGAYELIRGRIYFAVDPRNAHNRPIVDLDLADRDAAGAVEFSADFSELRPVDPARGNGAALVEIPNRGTSRLLSLVQGAAVSDAPRRPADFGDGWLLRQGFVVAAVGWQWDAPPGTMRLYPPIAYGPGHAPLRGWLRDDFCLPAARTEMPLGHLITGHIGGTEYAVADPDDPGNRLTVRDSPLGARREIARSAWSFGADRRSFRFPAGFQPGRIYELVYTVQNPVVAGLGFAAERDFAAELKHGSSPELGAVRRVETLGISQCGRFLRQMLYEGFDADEAGRQAFDGIMAHVAGAGRGSFNCRFAQPSRDAEPMSSFFYPTDVFPFTAARETDPETGEFGGLLDVARAQGIEPKLFLSNTSHEYWARCASLISTTPDGAYDVVQPDNVRVYFWAGEQHFPSALPAIMGRADLAGQNRINPNPVRWLWRAMIDNLDAWVRGERAPPPSAVPSVQSRTLVRLEDWQFPAIRRLRLPEEASQAYRLDFGPEWNRGIMGPLPPQVGDSYQTLVPQTDEDGNDLGGVRLPELTVPVATYTGWNLRAPAIGAPNRRVSFIGSYLPFPRTNFDRRRTGDPRASLQERYDDKSDYLRRYRQAVDDLVKAHWALPEDVPAMMERGAEEWDAAQ